MALDGLTAGDRGGSDAGFAFSASRTRERASTSRSPRLVTRRVNFTFYDVPDEHVVPFRELPREAQLYVRVYVDELARHSAFFAAALR
jgi:hypothetical protein